MECVFDDSVFLYFRVYLRVIRELVQDVQEMVLDVLVLLYEHVPVPGLQLENKLVIEYLLCRYLICLTGMDSYNQVHERLSQPLLFHCVNLLTEPVLREVGCIVVK